MKNKPQVYPDLALHIALENLKGFVRKSNGDQATGKTTDTPTKPIGPASASSPEADQRTSTSQSSK